MRRIGMTLAALVSASAIAACGGSSSGGGDNPAGNTQPSSTAAAGNFDKTAATASANAALLTAHDLPGWTAKPADDSTADDDAVNGQLASCLGVDASFFAKDAPDKVEVKSDDFSNSTGGAELNLSESVNVETTARMTSDFTVINSPKLTGCLESVYGAFLKQKFAEDPQTKSATVGDVQAARGKYTTFGDESTEITLKVPFTIANTDAAVYISMVFMRVGSAGAQLVFEQTSQPVDSATLNEVATKAAGKLSQAAA